MQNLEYYITKLLSYCQKENFAGYDPYDGLNSRLIQRTPLYKNKIFRLMLIQGMKRLPINIRPLLLIPKTQNPKAVALFLMAFIKLRRIGFLDNDELIDLMIQNLITLRSSPSLQACEGPTENWKPVTVNCQPSTINREPSIGNRQPITDNRYYCWGYSFPWQTRTVLVPRGYPNLVCTVFVANALLDAYEFKNDSTYLDMAISAAGYILNELYWEEGPVAGFSYPLPDLKNKVHNANFLGAALLSRVYAYTGEDKFLEAALRAARYSASRQNEEGSWYYGEHPTQRWIDNFHTGYNLCALKAITKYGQTNEFEENINKGFEFYLRYFFEHGHIPKYFHDRAYPIDIHCAAQSVITLSEFTKFGNNDDRACCVLEWAVSNLWDSKGYFWYQAHPAFEIKISYMRWSQAWMLLALAHTYSNAQHLL